MKTQSNTRGASRRRVPSLANRILPGIGRPSNPAQIQVGMTLQGPPTKLTSQSSTGLISAVVTPSLNALTNTSFALCFDEWRLTGLRFHIRPMGQNGGSTKFVLDDEDAVLPNASYAASRRGPLLSNDSANPKSVITLNYKCANTSDFEWRSCKSSATYTPMSLKIYTDLSTYITQPSTDLWLISWEGFFEFRGIGNQN